MVAGFSSTIFLPLSQRWSTRVGWRDAVLVLAALLGACAVPHALLLRRAPQDLGLRPDGDVRAHAGTTRPALEPRPCPRAPGPVATRRPLADRRRGPGGLAVTVVAVHLVAYLRDAGSPPAAAAAAGAIGLMSVAGRIT